MPDLSTTVSSPIGAILELPGRVPLDECRLVASKMLRKQINDAEAHLAEIDNWTHSTRRGSAKAKTAEEMKR